MPRLGPELIGPSTVRLVGDGRDALVSWARMASEPDPSRYEAELRSKILNDSGAGTWGANVLSWATPPSGHRLLLRYEARTWVHGRDPSRPVHGPIPPTGRR